MVGKGRRFVRYGLVGVLASLLYVGLTAAVIELTTFSALAASITAFALSLPAAYWGHLRVTFEIAAGSARHITRFFIAMTNAFVVSTVSTFTIVNVMGAHYTYALVVTTVLVPLLNYAVLSLWVFSQRSPSHR